MDSTPDPDEIGLINKIRWENAHPQMLIFNLQPHNERENNKKSNQIVNIPKIN